MQIKLVVAVVVVIRQNQSIANLGTHVTEPRKQKEVECYLFWLVLALPPSPPSRLPKSFKCRFDSR